MWTGFNLFEMGPVAGFFEHGYGLSSFMKETEERSGKLIDHQFLKKDPAAYSWLELVELRAIGF